MYSKCGGAYSLSHTHITQFERINDCTFVVVEFVVMVTYRLCKIALVYFSHLHITTLSEINGELMAKREKSTQKLKNIDICFHLHY